jgi:hypothetical protein
LEGSMPGTWEDGFATVLEAAALTALDSEDNPWSDSWLAILGAGDSNGVPSEADVH